jgi:hypothetical protein
MQLPLFILLFLPPFQQSSVFAPQFRQVLPTATSFRTLYERPVTNELTLSVVLADARDTQTWSRDGVLGIFLRDRAGRLSTVTVMQNPRMECNVVVEHADLNSAVLSRTEPDYGVLASSMKIFIDPGTRRVIRTVEYWPSAVGKIWIERDIVFAQFTPRSPNGVTTVTVEANGEGFQIAQDRFTVPPRQPLPQGWALMESTDFPGEFSGINGYPLPPTSRQTLERLRPKAVRDEFGPREVDAITDHIGPYQLVGNLLWFGKTFYDGEGETGVGGFGYFDLMNRRYTMFTPSALRDWSASALLVEPDSIWIGLVNRPEGAENSGGLLRYDRTTMQTQLFPVKSVITAIIRHQGILHLGTDHGIYVMHDRGFTRFLLEPTLDGSSAIIRE